MTFWDDMESTDIAETKQISKTTGTFWEDMHEQTVPVKRQAPQIPSQEELTGPKTPLGPNEINIGAAPPPEAIVLDTKTGETRRDHYIGTMAPSHEPSAPYQPPERYPYRGDKSMEPGFKPLAIDLLSHGSSVVEGALDYLGSINQHWGIAVDNFKPDWQNMKHGAAEFLGIHPDDIDDDRATYWLGSMITVPMWKQALVYAGNVLAQAPGVVDTMVGGERLGKVGAGFKALSVLELIAHALPGVYRYGGRMVARHGKDLVNSVVNGYKTLFKKVHPGWKPHAKVVMHEALKASDIPQAERNAILEAFGESGDFSMADWRAIVSNSVKNVGDREELIRIGNDVFADTLPEMSSAVPSMNSALRLQRSRQLIKKGVSAENAMTKVTVDKAKSLGVAGIGDKVKLKGKVWQIGGATKRGYILHKGKQKINISADRLSKLQVVK